MRDKRFFKDPVVFNPERFREKVISLSSQGNNLQALNGLDNDDPFSIVYGFGRRCVLSQASSAEYSYTAGFARVVILRT